MTTLKIYDPAMCCSSGVCGPNVNEELVHLAGFLKGLDAGEVTVERYNLSQQPDAYAANPVVAKTLQEKGTDALPLVFVDDKLVCIGEYPSVDALSAFLRTGYSEIADTASDCCSGGSGGCCQ